MKLTDEQAAIVREGRDGKNDIIIDALAGCAKTTTLLEVIKVMPQRSILFAAFNRGIAQEAEARKPKTPGRVVVVQTLHAIGRSIILKHFPELEIEKNAPTEGLVNDAIDQLGRSVPFEVRLSATRLVRCAKETLSPAAGVSFTPQQKRVWSGWPLDMLRQLGVEQRLFSSRLTPSQIDSVLAIAARAILAGADIASRTAIDFCDMTWLPSVLDLTSPSRYQGIVLDEVQDVSAPQLEFIERLMLPTTRCVVTGDSWQQIYAWRGSLGEAVWTYFERRGARRLPLTMTWRCSRAVVRTANELVPQLRAQPNAEEGSIQYCTLGELPFKIGQGVSPDTHTFVLSRGNATLLDCALFLWRSGIKFRLNAGQMLLEPLYQLLDRELDLKSEGSFRKSLFTWHKREADKAALIGAVTRREQIDEQRAMLLAAARYATPSRLRWLLTSILSDKTSGVLLSSVHGVKGLEADRVFLLRETFARQERELRAQAADAASRDEGDLPYAIDARPIAQEELNIEYVAVTRARTHVIWVSVRDRERPELLTMPVKKIPLDDLDTAFFMTERAAVLAEDDDAAVGELTQRLEAIMERMAGGR